MSGRPRKGRRVAFSREDGDAVSPDPDPVIGLRFTISAQNGGEALIDFTALRPRRLAWAAGRALRHLAAPGGPLGARSTVKAFAVTIPKFFAYLADAGELVAGIETLRARHADGFEGWLEARGLTRINIFALLVKIVGVLRQVAIDSPGQISTDLRDRLRYISAKPYQRSRPRDAYSPFVARQLRDAARDDVTAVLRRCSRLGHWFQIRFCLEWKPSSMLLSRNVVSSEPISSHTRTCIPHGLGEDCRRISSVTNSTVVTTLRATISCRFLCSSPWRPDSRSSAARS
jgi:hypothetical protein